MPGHLAICGDILVVAARGLKQEGCCSHLMGREASDAARQPAVHKAISPITQNYPAQIASTAEVQKPWYIVSVILE